METQSILMSVTFQIILRTVQVLQVNGLHLLDVYWVSLSEPHTSVTRDLIALFMNREQPISMATTRMETTHGLTYSLARAAEVTAWQSIDAIYLCCRTHSACVKVTGLPLF